MTIHFENPPGQMLKILVLGGTGFVGQHVCEKLVDLQWRVTLPTRRSQNARPLQMLPLLTVLQGDVHDEATLNQLVVGHDAVVNLVAILHGDEAAFNHTHVELPQKLARACAKAGVTRVVHVSALGAALDAPSMYQRSKARGEQALQAAQLDLTLLRPSVIFGAADKFLNLFAKLQRVFPFVPLAGAATRFQPVWVQDVASAITHCLQHTDTVGKTFDLCGPEVFTLKELVQLAAQMSGINQGRGRPVFALPMALGKLQAALMSLAPGAPLMSRDNLDSMSVDNVTDGQLPGLQALGIDAASLLAIGPDYLGGQGKYRSLEELRKAAARA